ncbi:MAG TPA: substrate-binding domain-containing protein, partial [Candidatus Acidoferrales bacterium]|nr:substrate-binding domain-containing protein [Candidatus Acidoferrales bacterium]
MKRNRILLVIITGLFFAASSCNMKKGPAPSPTEGSMDVYCAESVSPSVTQIADDFNSLYSKAHITVHDVPSRTAIVKLLNNETKLIATSRRFNEDELDVMKKYNIEVDSMIVAYDAVVVIVNHDNPIDAINTDQLRSIFTGKITSWEKLEKGFRGRIIPALSSPNSGVVEFFKNRVLRSEKFAEAYPCTTMAHVYTFVRDNNDAIGFISADWQNAGPRLLPGKNPAPKWVQVAEVDSSAISYIDPNTLGTYYYPYQAHIGRRYYPLTHPV